MHSQNTSVNILAAEYTEQNTNHTSVSILAAGYTEDTHSVVNILAAGYTEHIQTAVNIPVKHVIVIDKYTVIIAQQKIQSRELEKKI
jgi:hypothetical protein